MIQAAIGASLYYLIPLGLGYGLVALVNSRRPSLAMSWATGSFALLFLVGLVNEVAGDRPPAWRLAALAGVAGASSVLAARRWAPRGLAVGAMPWAYPAVAVIVVLSQTILRLDSPYPAFTNWDALQQLTLAGQMERGVFSLDLTQYSDTFQLGTYLPLYHAPLFIAWKLSGAAPDGLYWFLDLLHGALVALVACRLGYSLRGQAVDGFLAGALSALILETRIAYVSFSHMAQTVTGVFFALCLAEFMERRSEIRKGEVGVQLAYMALSHFFVGAVGALLLSVLYLLDTLRRPLSVRLQNGWILGVTAFTLVLALQNRWFRFDPFNVSDSAASNLTLDQKFDFFRNWLGHGYWIYPALVVIFLLRTRVPRLKLMGAVLAGLVPALLLPVPYSLKLFAIEHFSLAALTAVTLSAVFLDGRATATRVVCGALFVSGWFGVFLVNQQVSLKGGLRFEGHFTQVSAEEAEAARFLASSPYRNSFVVSEPATQYILEGFSGVNSAGGIYATPANRGHLTTIAAASSPEAVRTAVFLVRDALSANQEQTRILAIGPRFRHWAALPMEQRLTTFGNIWSPRADSPRDRELVSRLAGSPGFRLLFSNSAGGLLEVTRP